MGMGCGRACWGLILGLVLDDALMERWAVLLDCDGPFVLLYQHDSLLMSRFEYACLYVM